MQMRNDPRPLYSVRQFSEKHPAFTQSALRNLIDKAKERYSSRGQVAPNGLAVALVRLGRRILIDEEAFFLWLADQTAAEAHGSPIAE